MLMRLSPNDCIDCGQSITGPHLMVRVLSIHQHAKLAVQATLTQIGPLKADLFRPDASKVRQHVAAASRRWHDIRLPRAKQNS